MSADDLVHEILLLIIVAAVGYMVGLWHGHCIGWKSRDELYSQTSD